MRGPHEHNLGGARKRVTSPTSATKIAANAGPTPGIVWMAW